jgi:hypothetical protein
MEGERFRDSLLTGSVPLKVVGRPPESSRVFPFEDLVVEHGDAAARVCELDYAEAWGRFREEFLALPSLEEGLAAFVGVAAPAGEESARSAPGRAKGVLIAV